MEGVPGVIPGAQAVSAYTLRASDVIDSLLWAAWDGLHDCVALEAVGLVIHPLREGLEAASLAMHLDLLHQNRLLPGALGRTS